MTLEEFNQIINRAEVAYGVFLIVFLLMYIAFYRHPKDHRPSGKR
jgi:hypothetical protein